MTDPYAYPEQPYLAPGWRPEDLTPRRRGHLEPLAVTALVCGVLALGPVAVVLGLVALPRARQPGSRGRGLAVAGVVLGAVGTVAWAALVAVLVGTSLVNRPLPADVAAPRDARAVQLVTGSCVADLPADGPVDHVRVVPCADPHEAQVLTTYVFADEAFPGADRAAQLTARACVLTQAERDRGLTPVVWAPSARSWASGDRTGLCLAASDEPMTGSLLEAH